MARKKKLETMLEALKKKCQKNDITKYQISKGTKISYPTILNVFKGNGTMKNFDRVLNYVDNKAAVYDPAKTKKDWWEKE